MYNDTGYDNDTNRKNDMKDLFTILKFFIMVMLILLIIPYAFFLGYVNSIDDDKDEEFKRIKETYFLLNGLAIFFCLVAAVLVFFHKNKYVTIFADILIFVLLIITISNFYLLHRHGKKEDSAKVGRSFFESSGLNYLLQSIAAGFLLVTTIYMIFYICYLFYSSNEERYNRDIEYNYLN